MLQVREVTKSYDERMVVNRVSFDVHPGEIFALLGPNGAGKTTLIRMITDILKPDSGTIELDGRPVRGEEKRRISYLPEERGLYRREKVLDILTYYARLKGLPRATAHSSALALLERVELREWAQKQVQALSKGMQQKLQLCTSLIGDPRVLILDEPFSGLDPVNVQLLESILQERRAGGATILLSTHQMNKVEELCDRALMMNHGQMVLYGPVHEIRRRHADHAVLVRTRSEPSGEPGLPVAAEAVGPAAENGFPGVRGKIPGVAAVEKFNGHRKLTLEPEATPQSVLKALVERDVEIESFEVAVLPLEDIFVKVVREGLGLDHGTPVPSGADRTIEGARR